MVELEAMATTRAGTSGPCAEEGRNYGARGVMTTRGAGGKPEEKNRDTLIARSLD